MKRNIIIKLFIDITMTVLYLLLMFAKGLDEFFHEAVGIGIGIIFVIHILMNLSMIKGLSKAVKKGAPQRKVMFRQSRQLRSIIRSTADILIFCF